MTVVTFNVEAELADDLTDLQVDIILDDLALLSPAVTTSRSGRPAVIVTVDSDRVELAAGVVCTILRERGHDITAVEAMSTAEFDRRSALTPT